MKWIPLVGWEVIKDMFKTTMKKNPRAFGQKLEAPRPLKVSIFQRPFRHENSPQTRKQGHFYFISSSSF